MSFGGVTRTTAPRLADEYASAAGPGMREVISYVASAALWRMALAAEAEGRGRIEFRGGKPVWVPGVPVRFPR